MDGVDGRLAFAAPVEHACVDIADDEADLIAEIDQLRADNRKLAAEVGRHSGHGTSAGALDAESTKSNKKKKKFGRTVWSRNRCFSYGFSFAKL